MSQVVFSTYRAKMLVSVQALCNQIQNEKKKLEDWLCEFQEKSWFFKSRYLANFSCLFLKQEQTQQFLNYLKQTCIHTNKQIPQLLWLNTSKFKSNALLKGNSDSTIVIFVVFLWCFLWAEMLDVNTWQYMCESFCEMIYVAFVF